MVLSEYVERLPLKVLQEPRPGKSHALNTAVSVACGEYLLFTDDDVRVDPGWLTAYMEAFRSYSEAVLFGGPVLPLFLGDEPPAWLEEGIEVVANAYALLDPGAEPSTITPDSYPYGANMAARREIFDQHRYPTEIGPRPGSRVRGEEMLLIFQMLESGGIGWWVPEATVQHAIPAERQTVGYLREYYIGAGQLLSFMGHGDVAYLFGRPRWAWRKAVQAELYYRARRHFAAPTVWLKDLQDASLAIGVLLGYSSAQD